MMKNPIAARLNWPVFFAVLIMILGSVPLLSDADGVPLYPTGKKIDSEIQFDSVLVLNAPLSQTKIALIVRYYVSEDAIAYDLLWAEPAWMSINYPYPPFELTCYVDDSDFRLYAAPHRKSWNYPMGCSRGVFTHIFNSYAIEDQRFAYTEYLATRLSANCFRAMQENPNVHGASEKRLSNYMTNYEFSPNQIGITRKEKYGQDENNFIISEKQVNYFYQGKDLIRTETKMPEYLMPVSGFSINVTDANKNDYTLTGIPALYHRGDRTAVVEYKRQLDTLPPQVLLPSRISVHSGTDNNRLLRSAKLHNFTKIPRGTTASKKDNPTLFEVEFEKQDMIYRALSDKYWYVLPDSVSKEDAIWFTQFAEYCLTRINSTEDDLAKLKYINRFTLAQMLSGHYDQVTEMGIPQYLSAMNNAELNGIGLIGINNLIGLCVIRKAKELLAGIFSSEKIVLQILEYPSELILDSLQEGRQNTDITLALLLSKCTDQQLNTVYSMDDVFLIRHLIVMTLGDVVLPHRKKNVSEKTHNLLFMLGLDICSITEIYQQQKQWQQKQWAAENYSKQSVP